MGLTLKFSSHINIKKKKYMFGVAAVAMTGCRRGVDQTVTGYNGRTSVARDKCADRPSVKKFEESQIRSCDDLGISFCFSSSAKFDWRFEYETHLSQIYLWICHLVSSCPENVLFKMNLFPKKDTMNKCIACVNMAMARDPNFNVGQYSTKKTKLFQSLVVLLRK